MIPINLADLRAAADRRPRGYLDDFLSAGEIRADFLWVPHATYEALRLKYAPRGLGDRIARLAKPIARAMDATLGTDLAHCQGCASRQAWLNTHFPTSTAPQKPL
jgi:hypothetical protein